MTKKVSRILTAFWVVVMLFAEMSPAASAASSAPYSVFLPLINKSRTVSCQFGIAIGSGSPSGVDYNAQLNRFRADAVIDWGAGSSSRYPDVDYINVLNVGDFLLDGQSRYQKSLELIETLIPTHRSQVWLIGNEPDTSYQNEDGVPQDNLLPEEYARRYYAMGTRIRQLDPDARLGFGNLVQPTPIRLRYLRRVWNELVKVSGSQAAASGLIDVWVTHAFILNEQPTLNPSLPPWGTGIPPGFENDYSDALVIGSNFALTHSITLFERYIRALRSLMVELGERGKPLWITEYGSLFPPVDPYYANFVNVSDQETAAYMIQTFDFLRSAQDSSAGLVSDSNHLVQRWFWYSLAGPRTAFGGTLLDPDNQFAPTIVGEAYLNYIKNIPVKQDCYP